MKNMMEILASHITYVAVTLVLGIVVGWVTYPIVAPALKRLLNSTNN